MKKSIKYLLEKGYFPEELPPSFTTKHFSNNFELIEKDWNKIDPKIKKKYTESICTQYSIPKVFFARRNISIPNPLHFSELCKVISNNIKSISKVFNKSKLSLSKPILNTSSANRAYIPEHTYDEFKKNA